MSTVSALYRYPVKGLSPEPLTSVNLSAGETVPYDRAYAIENGPSGFDPSAPRTLPKIHFLMLMRNERLATLKTRFDDDTRTLTIRRDGIVIAEGRLDREDGRRTIEAFFDAFEADELRGPTKVVEAPGFSFSDVAARVVSVINLETVRAIGRDVGAEVHPLRFRGNLYVEGLPAWEEFGWVGQRVAAGNAILEVMKRIERCAATNVDPDTGARDLTIPASLLPAYGHADCGIYLKVVAGGMVSVEDEIKLA